MKQELWTIVQHSGFGYGQKPAFKKGIEIQRLTSKSERKKVLEEGGLIFDSYKTTDDFIMEVSYPEGSGLAPNAPGSFSKKKIDRLRIWIPDEASHRRAIELGGMSREMPKH